MNKIAKLALGALLLALVALLSGPEPRRARPEVRRAVAAGLHQALRGGQDRQGHPQPVPAGRDEGVPAILDVKMAPYNWVIDLDGCVSITPEAAHPLGRTYEKGFYRPEDKSERKPGTRENFGHVSALGGAPGRISGEILYDKATNVWTITTSPGATRSTTATGPPSSSSTPPNSSTTWSTPARRWGAVMYLLAYAPRRSPKSS